eukprot:g3759.t1
MMMWVCLSHHGQHRQRPADYSLWYACLGCGFTFFILKPARDEFKFKMKRVTDDVDFQLKYDAKEYGRINIDYSTEEAKELARKEFMGDPFAKVKLKSEFTNTINLFKQKLLG